MLIYNNNSLILTLIIFVFLILQILNSGNSMTTEDIVQRIIRHRLEFEVRNTRKEKKELAITKALKNDQHLKQNGNCEVTNNS